MQVVYAVGSASELILFAYVYSVTQPGAYQAVTGKPPLYRPHTHALNPRPYTPILKPKS
jgi:hypothetical protein